MRILLDATAIPAERGGVGRYLEGLIKGLEAIDVARSFVIATQRRDTDVFEALAPSAQIFPAPAWASRVESRLVWEQTTLPLLARRIRTDVIHSPHYTYPLATGCPVVVTLHDATFFTLPDAHVGVKRRFFQRWTRRSVLHADGLVTVSDATRREVLRVVGGDPGTFTVAHLGVDHDVFSPPTPSQVVEFRRRAGIGDRPWIAFLGTLEPRKNVPALVAAYASAFHREPDPPLLLLGGSRGWDERVECAASAVPGGLEVRQLGYLPRGDLAAFLGGSLLVAYPSLGEGFGLPVLEAMACGSAVLTTRRLSIPEVGGDAVAYADVDRDSIASALSQLASNPERRAWLGRRALARAGTFTWEACATKHMAAYRRAAETRT